jgi:hypothetical protein
MHPSLCRHVLLVTLVMSSCGADAADPLPAGSISAIEDADGGVVLSNLPSTPAVGLPDAPAEPVADTAAVGPALEGVSAGEEGKRTAAATRPARPAGQPADSADPATQDGTDPAPKDPREAYRDRVMQTRSDEVGAPANPSLSRRYKAMDRAAYRDKVLGLTPAPAEAGLPKP